jgi:capsular exopolysaccharide synthesis family protein
VHSVPPNGQTIGPEATLEADGGWSGPAPELRYYLAVLRRRIWGIVTVLVVVITLGMIYAFKATPIYEGAAKIEIETQAQNLLDFTRFTQLQGVDRAYYRTQRELVLSRPVLIRALEEPSVKNLPEVTGRGSASSSLAGEVSSTASALLGIRPAPPPEPWERLRDILHVDHMQDTHLLRVRVYSADPKRAAALANAVARSFERLHLDRKLEASGGNLKFLQTQVAEQEEKLLAARAALQDFREQENVVSLDVGDSANPVLERQRRLSEKFTEVQLEREQLAAHLESVRDPLGADNPQEIPEALFSLPEVQADQTIARLRAELLNADNERTALAETYGADHPRLMAATAKADLVRDRLATALKRLVNAMSVALDELLRYEHALQELHDDQSDKALTLARLSGTYNGLREEVDRQSKLYDVRVKQLAEVDLTEEYTMDAVQTNVRVVEHAMVPRSPVKPRKMRLLILSAFFGLLISVAMALLCEHLDDTVKTPEDMEERIGVSVLGFVPSVPSTSVDEIAVVGMTQPNSIASEAYRNIRTSLFYSAPAEETKVLVVTSGGPGDGKTTTAANLALVIAQSGRRVLLVDTDFHRPRMHHVFGLDSSIGISTILVGEATIEDAIQSVHNNGALVEKLDVVTVGPRPPNPAELLDSERMEAFLKEVRGRYDRVILDTPPALFVADANILGAAGDGVILVVKSARNTRSQARRARVQLEKVGAHVLGGILNDVRVSRFGYYYNEYYSYGYDYYSRYGDDSEEGSEN